MSRCAAKWAIRFPGNGSAEFRSARECRIRIGRAPTAVTADRGYGYASVDNDLRDVGVRYVAIPRASRPGAARREFEHRKAFRTKIKWRTGCEGRINHLKRSYGWNRTELTTLTGARTWCGHGVFAHNLVKITALTA